MSPWSTREMLTLLTIGGMKPLGIVYEYEHLNTNEKLELVSTAIKNDLKKSTGRILNRSRIEAEFGKENISMEPTWEYRMSFMLKSISVLRGFT